MQDPDSGGAPEAAEAAAEDVAQAVHMPQGCGPGGDAEPLLPSSSGRLHELYPLRGGGSRGAGPGRDRGVGGTAQERVAVFGGRKAEGRRDSLTVPFRSPLEANIARGSLAPDAEPHPGLVAKELAVDGSRLIVRWIAEEPRLLRISIISFLEQLSLVVRTMLRFGPPVFR
ncbi:PREDICTED: EKC/KEOPS complex subunit LAGE3 [Chrysochloris asiatica]|uniref:L antigen family member 3 n=1 Tax=Chrysochloris asiatica TaxID=185453 RepID=A0A9B0U5B0_CHRAS|nr:PREDICTED: EKC/KEOPS complex subunit LAGE3 [Chrysochloris asiatica]